MALLFALTSNVVSFTILQSFLFFFTSILIIDKYVKNYTIFFMLLFIACPIFYGFSVYHEMSVMCLIAINTFIIIIYSNRINERLQAFNIRKKTLYFFVLTLVFYIIFGFRQNAFTIIPVILLIFIRLYNIYQKKLALSLRIIALAIGIISVSFVPRIFGIKAVYDSSPAGFVWEILSTIQIMPENKQKSYNTYLDYLVGVGGTKKALGVNSNTSVNGWLWTVFRPEIIGNKENAQQIKKDYINLLMKEPRYFIRNKTNFFLKTLGVGFTLIDAEYNYNRNNKMQEFGMIDNMPRQLFVESYHKTHMLLPLIRKPYIIFTITLILLILGKGLLDRGLWLQMTDIYLISVLYYAAFLINNQSFEFRYFFPSFCYLVIVSIAIIDVIIKTTLDKIRIKF